MTETPHLSVRGLNKQFVLHLLDGKRLTGFTDVSFDVPATRLSGLAAATAAASRRCSSASTAPTSPTAAP